MTETYKWYAAGYRYPVFETIRTGHLSDSLKAEFFSTAFYYPPGMHQYLKTDTANTELHKKYRRVLSNRLIMMTIMIIQQSHLLISHITYTPILYKQS